MSKDENILYQNLKKPLIKNESFVNKVWLKLSADLLVGKLLQTTKVGPMEGCDRFGESTG